MTNNIPLYTEYRAYARAHDEIPLWRESINENIRCKKAIEDAIRQSFDGRYLKPDCAEDVIREFGFDRVEYVLANTLHQLSYDGRFSWSNKEWGENIEIGQQNVVVTGSRHTVAGGNIIRFNSNLNADCFKIHLHKLCECSLSGGTM